METFTPPRARSKPLPGRLAATLGASLGILAIAAYVVQFSAHMWTVPWYLPILGSIAAALLLLALVMRPSWKRAFLVLMFGTIAAGEWAFLLSFTLLPPYTGPVAVGQPMPSFRSMAANGQPFTNESLRADRATVMTFFRGRW